jgi:NitT/TauT family transport system permease protein
VAARAGTVSLGIPGPGPPGSILAIGQSLRRVRPIILPIATVTAALLLWQLAAVQLHIPTVLLPTPSEIAREMWHALPLLIEQAVPTAVDTLLAFAAAAVLGIGLAIVITYSPPLRDTLYPNLVFFQLVPKVALAPLFVIWLGYGSPARVTFATFISFFPVVISAAVGFAGTDPAVLRLCHSLTASEWQSFLLVRFPFALPAIFSGFKVAMTMAVVGVIIGEFISSQAGLGHYILNAGSRLDTADVFAALCALSVLGVALYGAVALAELGVRRVYGRR